jgi:hypothetical protein
LVISAIQPGVKEFNQELQKPQRIIHFLRNLVAANGSNRKGPSG